jgi:hypothetical protein
MDLGHLSCITPEHFPSFDYRMIRRFNFEVMLTTAPAAQPSATTSPSFPASPSANKASNPASKSAPSFPPLATPMPRHPTVTPSYELTTSPSSSAAGTLSREAAPCSLRWKRVGNCSSICSLLCVITWCVLPIRFPRTWH